MQVTACSFNGAAFAKAERVAAACALDTSGTWAFRVRGFFAAAGGEIVSRERVENPPHVRLRVAPRLLPLDRVHRRAKRRTLLRRPLLARPRLLDAPGRQAPDRRSVARRDRHPARPRAVHRPARLPPVPAAGDPRRGAVPGGGAARAEEHT